MTALCRLSEFFRFADRDNLYRFPLTRSPSIVDYRSLTVTIERAIFLPMTESVETLYEKGLERYQAGESPETLIPVFQELCDRSPKESSAWCSLAWLYLISDRPKQALRIAQKAVKIDPRPPQVRINLALALLDTGETGVRSHIEVAKQIMAASEEIKVEVLANIEDGLKRKPDWKSLQKVKSWLLS